MKTVQARLINKGGDQTTNQPVVDLNLAHVESFRMVTVAKTVWAFTSSGNTYSIEGEKNLAIIQAELV